MNFGRFFRSGGGQRPSSPAQTRPGTELFAEKNSKAEGRGALSDRRVFLGGMAAALPLSLCAAPALLSASSREWSLVAMEDFPPYNYFDAQKFIGIDVDLMSEAALLLGVRLKTTPLPWPRAILSFEAGQADGLYQLAPTAWRFRHWNMAGPLRMTELAFAVRADDPRAQEPGQNEAGFAPVGLGRAGYDPELLAGHRVGVVNGFTYTPAFDRARHFARDGSIDDLTSLRKLLLGRVSTVLGGAANLRFAARSLGAAGRIRILRPGLSEVARYVGFRRDPAGDEKARLMQAALAELWLRGSVARILAAWGEA